MLTKEWRSSAIAALLFTVIAGQHVTTVTEHLTVIASGSSVPTSGISASSKNSPNLSASTSGSKSTIGTLSTRQALNLASPVVAIGSLRATVVSVTPTVDGSSTTLESAAALPTSSTTPLCGTIYLDEDNDQLSRIYCNANLLLGNLSATASPTTFDLCISICDQLEQCIGAVFDNTTRPVAGSKGTCTLKEIDSNASRKRQSEVDLVWRAGTYVALKLDDTQAFVPVKPTSLNASSSAGPTSSTNLIASIQPALDLSTTVAETEILALPTGLSLAASVSVTTESFNTASSSSISSAKGFTTSSLPASRVQAGKSSTTAGVVRVTRVTRFTVLPTPTPAPSPAPTPTGTATTSRLASSTLRPTPTSSATTLVISKSSSTTNRQIDSSTQSRNQATSAVSAPVSSTILPQSAAGTTQISTAPASTATGALAPRLSTPTLLITGVEETQYGITLPFNMSLYTQTSVNLTITTNGVLSLGSNTSVYEAYTDGSGTPPSLPTGILIPGSAAVWWQYLESFSAAGLGVYYQTDNNNFLSVEWLMYDNGGKLTNAVLTYNLNKPGSVTFYYFSDGDAGLNSSIGVQGLDTSNGWAGVTYETQKAQTVKTGMMLTFATGAGSTSKNGTVTSSTFDPTCFPKGSFPKGTCGTAAT